MRDVAAWERESTVILGGHPHYVYAGGVRKGPVVLLCHGGPGYSELPMIRAGTYARLQHEVLLVTWDQRGTGRSYTPGVARERLTVGRLLDDAIELVDWARATFDRDRVHLLGHSWGGCLALLVARRHQHALASLYVLCPFVDLQRSAAVAYRTLVERATLNRDAAALGELDALGAPPWPDLQAAMSTQTKWVVQYGGMVHGGPGPAGELFARFQDVSGYSEADYANASSGQQLSGEHLLDECARLDVAALVPSVDVRLTVGVGRHDLVNATEVTLDWYTGVGAAAKRLHVFEHSAHFPNFCEPDAFQASVLASLADD